MMKPVIKVVKRDVRLSYDINKGWNTIENT